MKDESVQEGLSRQRALLARLRASVSAVSEVCASVAESPAAYRSQESSSSATSEVTDVQRMVAEGSALLVALRGENRCVQESLESLRDQFEEKRRGEVSRVAASEGALRERIRHLTTDLSRTRGFQPQFANVDVVPLQEFLASAPAELTQAETNESSQRDHRLEVNRLMFELSERKRLHSQIGVVELELSEQRLKKKKQEEFLRDVRTRVRDVSKTARSLQEAVPLQAGTPSQQQAELAARAPGPLYVLFHQVNIYKETADNSVGVNITGSLAEAINFDKVNASPTPVSTDNMAASASGGRRSPQAHPISVAVTIPVPVAVDLSQGSAGSDVTGSQLNTELILRFEFYPELDIIAVTPELRTSEGGDIAITEVATDIHNVLSYLYPHDTGRYSPNASKPAPTGMFQGETRAFRWAQWLGGVDFLSTNLSHGTSGTRLELQECGKAFVAVRARLQQRIRSQVTLRRQLRLLALDGSLPPQVSSVSFPTPPLSRVTAFQRCSDPREWLERHGEEAQEPLFVAGTLAFFGTLQLASTGATAPELVDFLVNLPLDYPEGPPSFVLSKKSTSGIFDNSLGDVEHRLNCSFPQLTANGEPDDLILALMFARLLKLLDVLAAASSQPGGVVLQGGEETRVIRGRDRNMLANWVSEQ